MYVDIVTCSSDFQPQLYIFTDPSSSKSFSCSTTNMTCGDSTSVYQSHGMQNVRLLGGLTYFVAVEGADEISGQYTLLIAESSATQTS